MTRDAAHEFAAGFLFCGLGAGARGFLQSRADLRDAGARFRSVGGIDLDAEACADFEKLTGSPATRADLATMSPEDLRAAWGETVPDILFMSPPCKGFSGLLSAKAAKAPKYQALNELVERHRIEADTDGWHVYYEDEPRHQIPGGRILSGDALDDRVVRSEGRWRAPLFMPRATSRCTVEVLSVCPERVQSITEEDARREGVDAFDGQIDEAELCAQAKRMGESAAEARVCFAVAWRSMHGDSWDRNDWVWRIVFRLVEADGG